ncbi:hypothetical protein H920_07785 [Fukomys damarensis]|uniref:Uncharacterized protein n=1 Tax=Fukomys damarensis TaxID=885580 RepID=A0A091DKM2_FUKDA|nr:hypothetical protein H920_07785 [Fukomys damarensis]
MRYYDGSEDGNHKIHSAAVKRREPPLQQIYTSSQCYRLSSNLEAHLPPTHPRHLLVITHNTDVLPHLHPATPPAQERLLAPHHTQLLTRAHM